MRLRRVAIQRGIARFAWRCAATGGRAIEFGDYVEDALGIEPAVLPMDIRLHRLLRSRMQMKLALALWSCVRLTASNSTVVMRNPSSGRLFKATSYWGVISCCRIVRQRIR